MSGGVDAARRALDAGLAHNSAGRPSRASASFRAGLRHLGDEAVPEEPVTGDAAERAYLRSRCLLGLVVSEHERHADLGRAEAGLDAAARWARAAGAAGLGVAIEGQRGLVRVRAGDVEGAVEALDVAAARVDDAEPVDACRILLNRGTLLLELGRLDPARADLGASVARATAIGDTVRLVKARHNLGYAEFLAGDLPAALRSMSEAAAGDHGVSPAVALLDRARVLVEAGLVSEADDALAEAAALLATQRVPHELAQVELTRARCALLAGRPDDALRWSRSARRTFRRRRNASWAALADLAVCQAELARLLDAPPAPDGGAARARRTALLRLAGRAELVAEPGRRVADPWFPRAAGVTAAEARAAAGDLDGASALLAGLGRLTGREPVALAVRQRLVDARVAFGRGDTARARRHVRAGEALLAEHRRQLGSVDTVVAAAVHGRRLAALDLGQALAAGRPDAVLEAVERGRATFAGPARVRPPDDPALAELLSDLRRTLEQGRAIPPDAGQAGAAEKDRLRREAARLRGEVRARSWHRGDGASAPRAADARELVAAVRASADGVTLVDVVVHDGEVHAVVVEPTSMRLVPLGPTAPVGEALRRVRADLEARSRALPAPLGEAVARSLSAGLRRLDDLLLGPLGVAGPLHVVADGSLLAVPWGVLPSRRGVRTSVAERASSVRPAGAVGDPGSSGSVSGGRGVLAVAGPGLVHAEEEAGAVAGRWPSAQVLTGDDASCREVRAGLGDRAVVHLAAHGHHEAQNPLFSWVRLADGPLFAHELEGIAVPGSVVVLSACEVGLASERSGGQVLGLASVLLRLGAAVVVAGLAPLRDDVAARVMPELHARLSAGAAPDVALAEVSEHLEEPVPLTCFVAGLG